MQRHHTGSGRRTVIPPDWSAHHAPAADGTHTATVQIGTAGGPPVFEESLGYSVSPALNAIYDGPASIAPVTTPARSDVAGEDVVAIGRYVVSIGDGATARITNSHLVVVTAASDPDLVGRRFTVHGVSRASEAFDTDLHCTLTD